MTGPIAIQSLSCSRWVLFETIFPALSQRNAGTKFSQRNVDVHLASPSLASRSLQTSAAKCKIFEVPSPAEAEHLKQLYLNPKCLIHDLLQPLVHSGVTVMPQMTVAPRLGGRFWRAKLQLQWPSKVTISAVHDSVAGAEENAYLLACDLLKNMGLLYQPPSGNMMPVSQAYVLKLLQELHSCPRHSFTPTSPKFHFTTRPACTTRSSLLTGCGQTNSEKVTLNQLWRTDVAASWPYAFDVSCLGPSLQASKYSAALHTSIKLKGLGLLSNTNSLASSRLSVICRHQRTTISRECFDPHYEIYSDASAFAFGAYLVEKGDNPVHWLVNTWSDHFPDCPRIKARVRQELGQASSSSSSVFLESTFCELYAVVTACFTWKHKFVGKRVWVWTDNMAVVDMLNWGLQGEVKMKRWGKLLRILVSTCQKYSIELHASHIQRSENIAADLLSRCKLSAFREVVPKAAPLQKKTKKLLFWNPLQSVTCTPDLHPKFI